MNYRHIYHAGSFTDVMKHAVVAIILSRLGLKQTPYGVLDTHAGIGRYDLASPEAGRTGEHLGGISRIMAAADGLPDDLAPYLDAIRDLNGTGGPLRWYPGSPRLARMLMRPSDRLLLAELHPEDVETLRQEFARDRNTSVQHMDGYHALKAHLPLKERRGMVLIDPPFETPDEFERMVAALALGHGRWPTGIYALWYPIKERPAVWRFQDSLERTGIRKILVAELTVHEEDTHKRLNGCGMIVVNPPWQLDKALRTVLPALHGALGAEAGGSRVEWLVPE
ncbi:23S rRNA (adenine(2030)-N(6))-methyltransferase RlmJ [Skermanella rosea]|uniref:23S rRNA (adenine(2030)-N(6))-methyltransferase RlmJ n=1 Tax=Skermanella rosea TaxID=1817965 RepID=UPI00193194FD|nr:23S rRNA (adenine(2030)-N(6))-methyltransferase RlmJ [Skermanella rosea]UEM05648.1 23S rRNA (adenine(2030)-N(6))-methyltransferase RlmJ [Skermanella rosea]